MKAERAKSILRVYRPGGADERDPLFSEAREQVMEDPGLCRWFEDQREFDSMIASGLREAPVPDGLRSAILREGERVKARWWQGPVRLTVAAVLIGLFGLMAVVVETEPLHSVEMNRLLVDELWNAGYQVDFKASDLRQVRDWLKSRGVRSDFDFPSALDSWQVVGARVLRLEGGAAAAVCLQDGSQHAHFVVMPVSDASGPAAETSPVFEKVHGWGTASWRRGERLYVVSGMTTWEFLQKFRKHGQWSGLSREETQRPGAQNQGKKFGFGHRRAGGIVRVDPA